MIKKINLNIFLILSTYILPTYFLYTQQEVNTAIESIRLIALFIGAILLIYLNNRFRKQDSSHKWLWIFFEIIGILGLIYSGFVLFLLFELRNCCDIL